MNAFKKFRNYFYCCLIISVTSCSLFLKEDLNKSDHYKLIFSESDWSSISPDNGDYAFRNNSNGSILFVNSFCKKYDSSTLDQLSSHLFGGIENVTIEKKKKSSIYGRDSIHVLANGKLDGVKVFISLKVFKKDRCTYDFILVAKNISARDSDSDILDKAVKGVSFN